MRGYSPFTKTDSPEKANEIKNFIKNNMNKMSDKELMKKVNYNILFYIIRVCSNS